MKTMVISEDLLRATKEYFMDLDFYLMNFLLCVVITTIMIALKMITSSPLLDTNLAFYLTSFTIILGLGNLSSKSFSTGWFTWPDETKVQVLFAFKSFVMVWCALEYSEGALGEFMGLDVDQAHDNMVRRANKIFNLSSNEITVAREMSYTLLATVAALISFMILKINVNFAFYFFAMTRTASRAANPEELDAKEDGQRFSFN